MAVDAISKAYEWMYNHPQVTIALSSFVILYAIFELGSRYIARHTNAEGDKNLLKGLRVIGFSFSLMASAGVYIFFKSRDANAFLMSFGGTIVTGLTFLIMLFFAIFNLRRASEVSNTEGDDNTYNTERIVFRVLAAINLIIAGIMLILFTTNLANLINVKVTTTPSDHLTPIILNKFANHKTNNTMESNSNSNESTNNNPTENNSDSDESTNNNPLKEFYNPTPSYSQTKA